METKLIEFTKLFPETKTEIKTFAEQMIQNVLDGLIDPLKVKVQISAMKKTIEEIEANNSFKECVMKEAYKYHKEELKDIHNSNIQIKETGVKYDYSVCGMPEYDSLVEEIAILSERKKSLEKRLQTIIEPEQYICPETSEMVTLNPPIKTSTTTIVVTINK